MVKKFLSYSLFICFLSAMVLSPAYAGFFDFFKKKKQVVKTVVPKTDAPQEQAVDQKKSKDNAKTITEQIEEQCNTYAEDLVRLAYHEAAHLLLCIAYKRPVSKAIIYPDKLDEIKKNEKKEGEQICLGEVTHTLGISHVDKSVMIDQITIECAGGVAEILYFKDKALYADDDMFRVRDWSAYTLKRWDAAGKERKYTVDEKVDPLAVVELKNLCIQRAQIVLTSQEGLLTAFADGLLSLNLLDPAEIAKITTNNQS